MLPVSDFLFEITLGYIRSTYRV